jgi:uncharacterized protein YfaS (alpha-2-macroglobulin family)
LTNTSAKINYMQIKSIIPAGLQPINLHLIKTVPSAITSREWYGKLNTDSYINKQEFSIFESYSTGTNTYYLPVVATTKGKYIVNPARVESMYIPELWAVTDYKTIEVK